MVSNIGWISIAPLYRGGTEGGGVGKIGSPCSLMLGRVRPEEGDEVMKRGLGRDRSYILADPRNLSRAPVSRVGLTTHWVVALVKPSSNFRDLPDRNLPAYSRY